MDMKTVIATWGILFLPPLLGSQLHQSYTGNSSPEFFLILLTLWGLAMLMGAGLLIGYEEYRKEEDEYPIEDEEDRDEP